MKSVRVLLRSAHRALTDENVDLWLLTAAAAVFTILGIIDVAKMNVLSSAILALLAALAFAQIKSRKLVAQLATDRDGTKEILLRDFPDDLIRRRAEANDILLIGISMARTIQGARLPRSTEAKLSVRRPVLRGRTRRRRRLPGLGRGGLVSGGLGRRGF
ncbi:hypothetical protein [Kribbella catacumbae]|uniref:hypothetical protein n=1 Tax=Kribbella catacumbae TaxID=460086 RepID=UPI0012F795C3|nr:hypothetical protein [Kribbella catacumbae]